MKKRFLSGLVTLLLLFTITGMAQATLLNTELVINGDAEYGDTSGWNSNGIFAQDTGLNIIGNYSFTGGTGDYLQYMTQSIDVSDLLGLINSGNITFNYEIYLQSRGVGSYSQRDTAVSIIRFLDIGGGTLNSIRFEDTDYLNLDWDWDLFSSTGLLPYGTTEISLYFETNRTSGISSDGFADEISLVLTNSTPVPEPTTMLLLGSGLMGLAGLRRKFKKA